MGTRKPQHARVFVEHDFSDAIAFRFPRGPWYRAVFPTDAFRITRARFGNVSDVRFASRPRGGAHDRGEARDQPDTITTLVVPNPDHTRTLWTEEILTNSEEMKDSTEIGGNAEDFARNVKKSEEI